MQGNTNSNSGGGGSGGGNGPCGACKFLRRKCVKGCIFAPYFDSEQGSAHFAAVHKIFGASNVSKLLLRLPVNKRLDAVVTICYEALARIRDPVYGCVAHIFALQQQVVNLQTELAMVQAHLSSLEFASQPMLPNQSPADIYPSPPVLSSCNSGSEQLQRTETGSYCSLIDQGVDEEGDLLALAREFVNRYLPGVRVRPSSSC